MRLPNILWDHRNKLFKRIELIYVQESEEKAKNIKNIITRHGYDNIMMCTKMPTNNQNCTVIQVCSLRR